MKDSLDTTSEHLAQLADVGWVWLTSEEDGDKLCKVLKLLGYDSNLDYINKESLWYLSLT